MDNLSKSANKLKEKKHSLSMFKLQPDEMKHFLSDLAVFEDTISRNEFFEIINIFGLKNNQIAILEALGKNYNSFNKRTKIDSNKNEIDIYLDNSEAYSFKLILRSLAIQAVKKHIKEAAMDSFHEIPSEIVSFWIYSKKMSRFEILSEGEKFIEECVLLDETVVNMKSGSENPEFIAYRDDIRRFHKNMTSLISFPLAKNSVIRRTGERIRLHPFKRFNEHRNADYAAKGKLHSILRYPVVCDDEYMDKNRNRPYFFVSFENKLINGEVVEAQDEESNIKNIFTKKDEQKAAEICKKLFIKIKPFLLIGFHDDIPMKKYLEIFGSWDYENADFTKGDEIIPPYPDLDEKEYPDADF